MSISSSYEFLKEIKKKPENFFIIHYSCQSLYDDNESLSPRITSIAVEHFSSGQIVSFSTHAIAEELHIERQDISAEFDEIEKALLSNFYNFVRDRRDKFWVHWNMRNLTYGFEHIQHRYNVLVDNNSPVIPVEMRINLNDIIVDKYGSEYATHPKLLSLMEMNGGRHRHFMTGEEEVEAFKNNELIRLHNSTLCKVGFFSQVIKKMLKGKLRTKSFGVGIMLDRLFESRLAKAIGFIGTIAGVVIALLELL